MSTYVFSARDGGIREYNVRRTHRKSRAGCTACKNRRVKCDEQRPSCSRCIRQGRTCEYQEVPPDTLETQDAQTALIRLSSYPPQITRLQHNPLGILSSTSTITTPKDLHLLHHYFALASTDQFIGGCNPEIVTSIWPLARDHHYLLHAVLGISALHIVQFCANIPDYHDAKLAHGYNALHTFQRAINQPIAAPDVDAVLTTAMLLNIQYFSWVGSLRPEDSWVWVSEAEQPDRLYWLSVQLGLRLLRGKLGRWRQKGGVWSVLRLEGEENNEEAEGEEVREGVKGRREQRVKLKNGGLPKELVQLCAADGGIRRGGVFFEPLCALSELMGMDQGKDEGLYKFVRFVVALDTRFIALLKANDHCGLLVLAYWFGTLCRVQLWWCLSRVRRDCWAICAYLDRYGDERTRRLLRFPAEMCEYTRGKSFSIRPTTSIQSASSSNVAGQDETEFVIPIEWGTHEVRKQISIPEPSTGV